MYCLNVIVVCTSFMYYCIYVYVLVVCGILCNCYMCDELYYRNTA